MWGSFVWVDGQYYTERYIFWGTPKSLQFREYATSRRRTKSETLSEKIKMHMVNPEYQQLDKEMRDKYLPNLESDISMYMLAKKLRK